MHLNKIIVSTTFFLISTSVFANLEVSLKTRANLGETRAQKFEKTKNGYLLNGLIVNPQMIYMNKKSLQTILRTEKVVLGKCPAGIYELEVKSKKTTTEKGCLGTERFGHIEKAFATLRGVDSFQ